MCQRQPLNHQPCQCHPNRLIRPLAYVPERDLIAYAQLREFPIIPCSLCGSQDNLKRQEINRMIAEWDTRFPSRSWNVFGALSRVVPSHLLDTELFDFAGLTPDGLANPNGDTAFDPADDSAMLDLPMGVRPRHGQV